MKGRLGWPLLVGVLLLAAVAGYRLGDLGKQAEAPAPTPTGSVESVFGLALTDIEARPQNLAQWRGKVLVVNYWATWCPPCRDEMPGFSRLQQQYRDNGVQFVGISNDDAAKIIDFLKETPTSYPLLIGNLDAMRSSANLGNNRQALPFTAVFDRQGALAMTKLGRLTEGELEPELKRLISP